MLVYCAYVNHLTGAWFGWARLHEAWGRSYSGLAPVERAYGWITDEGLLHVVEGVPYDTLNSLGLIFVLLMLWPVARRLGFAYAAFVLVNVVPPMLAGGVLSMGRLTATLFPAVSRPGGVGSAARRPTAGHRVRDRPGTGGRAVLHLATAFLNSSASNRHGPCLRRPRALQPWSIIGRN